MPNYLFLKKMNNKFYEILLKYAYFWGEIYIYLKICKKNYKFIGIPNTHLFPLHNEPSPMPVGLKLWEE